jgi:hypothetical protein
VSPDEGGQEVDSSPRRWDGWRLSLAGTEHGIGSPLHASLGKSVKRRFGDLRAAKLPRVDAAHRATPRAPQSFTQECQLARLIGRLSKGQFTTNLETILTDKGRLYQCSRTPVCVGVDLFSRRSRSSKVCELRTLRPIQGSAGHGRR